MKSKATTLLHILTILSCTSTIYAFSIPTPPTLGIGSILFRPKNMIVQPNLGDVPELDSAAQFFTDAFWTGKIGGADSLSPKQYKILGASQRSEFRKRYGSKPYDKQPPQDRRSELIICKNSITEEIYGCAGIEVSTISTPNGKSASSEWKGKAPLMSNLAVGKSVRRKGIAEDMIKAAEDMACRQWGYDACYLLVEKRNAPAFKLYKKLGYRVQWEDDTAKTLVPTKKGSVKTKPTVIICMKKKLGGGLLGRLFG